MWRAIFLALGIFSCVLGLECLLIDKAIMAQGEQPRSMMARATGALSKPKELEPPPWAPWSLMSCGAIVIIYTFTLPQKLRPGGG